MVCDENNMLLRYYILPNGQYTIPFGADRSHQTSEKDVLCFHQQDRSHLFGTFSHFSKVEGNHEKLS